MAEQPQQPQMPKKKPAARPQPAQQPASPPKGPPPAAVAAGTPEKPAKPSKKSKKEKKAKKPKINFKALDYRIEIAQEYTNLWQKFFTFFGEGFEGKRIGEAQEKEFHDILKLLAEKHYPYCEIIGELLDNKVKNLVLDIVSETVSLSHIKMISVSEFNTLMQDWHSAFISMNIALGHILGEQERIIEKRRTKEAVKKKKKGEKEPAAAKAPQKAGPQQKPQAKADQPAPGGQKQPPPSQ